MPVGPTFVDFAITHELGHAICQEKNERLANEYGKELRQGKIPRCKNAAALEIGQARK
jgi:Zn-dependent peptidase ImmA (M78 family)